MALIQVNLEEMNLLLVDDSRTDRLILKSILKEVGVGLVRQAENGEDALEQLKTFPADLVICDLHMDPMDGIEFTRRVRDPGKSPNPILPVLMVTADSTPERVQEALGAGINGFMSKPVKPDTLRRQITGLFSRPMIFVRVEGRLIPLRTGARPDAEVEGAAKQPKKAAGNSAAPPKRAAAAAGR
ncbi:MAG: response regulator [Kiloniellales bacterium]|jgi:CheY-like chemotaxis protein